MCKARVRLEEGDRVNPQAERHPGGKAWVTVDCPTHGCGNAFTIERLNQPFGEQQPPAADGWGLGDGVEAAWGIIANAGGGDWERESPEWQAAAAAWRDRYVGPMAADCRELAEGDGVPAAPNKRWFSTPT